MTIFEDRYYSMPEICKYLGISRDSALKWIANKGMQHIKLARIGKIMGHCTLQFVCKNQQLFGFNN